MNEMKRSAKEQKEHEEEFYENSQQGKKKQESQKLYYIYICINIFKEKDKIFIYNEKII